MPKRPASEGARGGDRTGGGTDDEFGPLEDKTPKVVLGKPPFEVEVAVLASSAARSARSKVPFPLACVGKDEVDASVVVRVGVVAACLVNGFVGRSVGDNVEELVEDELVVNGFGGLVEENGGEDETAERRETWDCCGILLPSPTSDFPDGPSNSRISAPKLARPDARANGFRCKFDSIPPFLEGNFAASFR